MAKQQARNSLAILMAFLTGSVLCLELQGRLPQLPMKLYAGVLAFSPLLCLLLGGMGSVFTVPLLSLVDGTLVSAMTARCLNAASEFKAFFLLSLVTTPALFLVGQLCMHLSECMWCSRSGEPRENIAAALLIATLPAAVYWIGYL